MRKFKVSAGVLIALIAILFSTFLLVAPAAASASAADESAHLTQTRLSDTHVEFRIEFSSPLSGSFGGVIGGKHFNCQRVSDTVLICVGIYRVGSAPATLTLYAKPSGEVVFRQVISAPKSIKEKEETPTPEPTKVIQTPPPPPTLPPGCSPARDVSGC